MRYRFQWFIHLRAHTAYKEGRWAPRLHFSRDMAHFTFTLTVDRVGRDGPCSHKFCLKYRSLTLKMPCIISRFRLPSASTTPNALNIHGTPSNTSIVSAPDRRVQWLRLLLAVSTRHDNTANCMLCAHYNVDVINILTTPRGRKKGTTFLLRINLLIRNVIWQNLVLIIVNEYYH